MQTAMIPTLRMDISPPPSRENSAKDLNCALR